MTTSSKKDEIQEVKYSLRELLVEVEEERGLSHFAREAVDQEEIGKLFRQNRTRGKKRAARD